MRWLLYLCPVVPEQISVTKIPHLFRVRNITLGYNFKPNQLGALSKLLSGIRVYVDVQNPFTFTGYTGLDPEVNTGGNYKGGKAEYPQTRTFSLGAKLSF